MTDLYTTDKGWIRICPVCNREEKLSSAYKYPTKADIGAGRAYIKAQVMDYSDAEKRFLRSYYASSDEDLKTGYLWWAVKCCFGVEYVETILNRNDPKQRKYQYVPIIARFPYNTKANEKFGTLREFKRHLRHHPCKALKERYDEMCGLYEEIGSQLKDKGKQYEVFIAWHDREDSEVCEEFAIKLARLLNDKRINSFQSSLSIDGLEVQRFEAPIYAALATARVFVIVIDDYDALEERFLKWEIRRFKKRIDQDQSNKIVFCGVEGHVGKVSDDFLIALQHHEYKTNEVETFGKDIVKLINDMSNGEKKPSYSAGRIAAIMIAAAALGIGGVKIIGGWVLPSDDTTTMPPHALTSSPEPMTTSVLVSSPEPMPTSALTSSPESSSMPISNSQYNAQDYALSQSLIADLEYTVNDEGGITISRYIGVGNKAVVIPDIIDDRPVTSIGKGAFRESGITSVCIPGSVKVVNEDAFMDCDQLEAVTISEGVQKLLDDAFGYCDKLRSLNIPASIRSISSTIIERCPNLSELTVSEHSNWITVQNGLLITNNTEIMCAVGLPDQIVIDQGPEIIWHSAFRNQDNLTHIDISEGIKEIYDDAFRYCDNLESVILPASLENYGKNIFDNCPKLTWICGRNDIARKLAEELGVVYVDLNDSGLSFNLSWTANEEGGVTITGYTGTGNEAFTIPAAIDGKPVTRIAAEAFKDKSITSVFIPGSVRVIERSAFWNCDQLESVTISEGVKELQYGAFGYCDKLRSLNIPASIQTIDPMIINCSSLNELTVSDSNTLFTVNSGLLIENGKDLIGTASVSGRLTLPQGIQTIRNNVFENQSQLTDINIPEGIKDIQDEAFCSCDELESVTLPSSLESLGKNVFFDCSNLKWIYGRNNTARKLADELGVMYVDLNDSILPDNLSWEVNEENGVTITGYAGAGNEKIVIPTVIDGKPVTRIGVNAFKQTSITNVFIPGSVKVIEQGAFRDCDQLKSVTISEGVKELQHGVFSYCDSLWSLNIPASVEVIDSIIQYCPSLSELTISEDSGWITLQNGLMITNQTEIICVAGLPDRIEIPQGTETIWNQALRDQDHLTHVDIPEGIKNIKDEAFIYCSNLKSITLPASLENCGENIFDNCPQFKWIYGRNDTARKLAEKLGVIYVDLNDSVLPANILWTANEEGGVTITGYTGADNEALVIPSVIDGKPVTKIGESAFAETTIASVSIPGSVRTIALNAFWDCNDLKTVELAEGICEIVVGAFGHCDQLETLHIPSTAVSINEAIIACPKLENLTIAAGNSVVTYENGFLIKNGKEVLGITGQPSWSTVPQGIESIKRYAFMHQADLIIVELPESLKEIPEDAFSVCNRLEGVIVPATIESLNPDAFSDCPALKWIFGWNNAARKLAEKLGIDYVDLNCLSWEPNDQGGITIVGYKGDGNEALAIPSVINGKPVTRIGVDAFKKTSITNAFVSGSVKVIERGAFWNCDQLESVVVFEGVQHLLHGVFGYCDNLYSLSIPASVESIEYIIANCPNLTELTVSPNNPRIAVKDGLLIADNKTLKGVVGLPGQVVIPQNIDCIGEEAFNSQHNLTHIDIPEGVKEIQNQGFIYCSNLESVSLPESLKEVGTDIFSDCPKLRQIYGKNSIARKLAEMLGVEYVDVSDSVQLDDLTWEMNSEGGVTITKYTGKGTEDIVIPDQIDGKWVTAIGNLAFTNNHEIVSVELGSNTTKIGSNSFENCSNLEKLVIPAPLKSYGTYALDRCKKLKTIVGDKESKAPALAKRFGAAFVEN